MTEQSRSMDVAGRKLMIAIPAYDGKLNIKTSFALADLVVKASKFGVQVQLSHLSGCSLITKARNILVANFLESDCTDMLFIDADIVVDAESVLRLLALSTGKDITAGAYPRRAKDRYFFADLYFNENQDLEFDGSLMRVERVGTGFMLIQRHVLEDMAKAHEDWTYEFKGEQITALFDFALKDGKYVGEDYLFCDRAREHGYKIYIDVDISLPHVGTDTFENNFREEVVIPLLEMVRKSKLKVANG